MEKREFATSKIMKARISPKKVGPVADIIRGKAVKEAKIALIFDTTKAAKFLLKLITSAEANAVTNHKMTKNDLMISRIWVGSGPTIKSGQPVARGRFNPILKRSSNIYVELSERTK